MKQYHAYGLTVSSEFDLSPMLRRRKATSVAVTIKKAPVSAQGIAQPNWSRSFSQIGKNCIWLNVPGIARFQIEAGKMILVDPYPEADEASIVVYLLGSALGGILHQRGFLVLHANALQIDHQVVLIAGHSGSGKSTTAAAILQHLGEERVKVICDDVAAVDLSGKPLYGLPRIKLWEESLRRLKINWEQLERIRPQVRKYTLPTRASRHKTYRPVKAIYILGTANEKEPDQFQFIHLDGIRKFRALRNQTYRPHFVQGLGTKEGQLKQGGVLATQAHMVRIIRPTVGFNAPELAKAIINDLSKTGT